MLLVLVVERKYLGCLFMMTVLFKLTSTFASTFEKQKESSFEQKEEEDETGMDKSFQGFC